MKRLFLSIFMLLGVAVQGAWADVTVTTVAELLNVVRTSQTVTLGADNTLYYPSAAMTVGAFRGYFQLAEGLTAGDISAPVRAFVLNFGDDEATGIVEPEMDSSFVTRHSSIQGWYTLDGRRLTGKPVQRGVYVNGQRKVVIGQ